MEQNQDLKPTPAAEWQGINVEGSDLLLPSGNVARVKQISPQAFLSSGLIPNPLMAIIRKSINEKSGLPPNTMKKIVEDPKLLASSLELFDRVLANVMVSPEVEMPPTCTECGEYANTKQHDEEVKGAKQHKYNEASRVPGVLYADVVLMEDKMFIFQWCLGGTRDLEAFRSELESSMGDLSDGEDVPVPAI